MKLIRKWLDVLLPPAPFPAADFPLTGAQMGKAYLVGNLIYAVGSLLPLLVVFCIIAAAPLYFSAEFNHWLFTLLFDASGMPTPTTLIWLMLTSFIFGFGAELSYYKEVLAKRNLRLREVVGLDSSNLGTMSRLGKIYATLWRCAVLFLPWLLSEMLVHTLVQVPEQPTVQLARSMAGGNLALWFFLAAVLAPIFEELIFRGIIFQALRTTFIRWFRRGAEVSGGGLTGLIGRYLIPTPGVANFLAIVISGAIFSLQHLQFEPITLIMLWIMGCIFAEIFRRTNNLWFSIGLHAVNNAAATAFLYFSS